MRRALHDSLDRLQTDHIDLYQLHQPDPAVPIADTLAALDELVREGLVREIGCSNFSADQQVEAADAVADGAARFVSVQNELSLLERRRRPTAWRARPSSGSRTSRTSRSRAGCSPASTGAARSPPPGTRLANYNETPSDDEFDRVDALRAFAEEKGARCSSSRSDGSPRSTRWPP